MGAEESNAGDDFHFWWGASRALELIKPGTESTLLVVEGLGRVEDPEEQYETVDLAEYFGGDSFDSATRLVLSQLKYSTRHSGQAWTAARICQKRTRCRADGSKGLTRSVILDLADAFAVLEAKHGRDAVVSKVRISLVSNQPGDLLLRESVAAAAEWVRGHSQKHRASLLKALTDAHATVIKTLTKAIGPRLTSSGFCDFLAVLDLSETGALDRATLARNVRGKASEISPGRGSDSSLRLFHLVRQGALPDSTREGIRAADVLAELGVNDLLDLYPAPSRLVDVPDPLPAPGARTMANTVLEHLGRVVVAHGPAGAGKTTAMRQVNGHLPAGSAVVLFDCFGGGEYLSSGLERHTPLRFVTQVINDLAQQCGTPLLVQAPQVEDDQWRQLNRTLERAVATLDPGAVLVIAVDAADNAVLAANERGDRSFLPGLIKLPLPPRVTLLLTARSHRVESLGAAQAVRVDVVPFDKATSATHLRRHLPDATDADAAAFHESTNGNPRAQFYVLTQGDTANWDIKQLLEASARTPRALFDDIVASALQVSGADAGGQRWLALMLALGRPISTTSLAAALQVTPTAVDAFAAGLTPGIEVTGGAIQFRDEDFETHVRGLVAEPDIVSAHDRLSDLFLATRAEDADAAVHVADHLFHAGRLKELLDLVLEEDTPLGIGDGFLRQQVQGRRLDLAARAAAETGSAATAIRVAARACDTASRIDTLATLVESHLDLVARFADVDLLRTYALRQSRDDWLAPTQRRLAAALSRNPDRRAAARAALDSADAWIRRWMADRQGETRHWNISVADIAAGAEARYRLDGLDAAVTELRRWRPVQAALDAAADLVDRLAGEIEPDVVQDVLRAQGVPLAAQAPILTSTTSTAAHPAPSWIDEVATALLAAEPGEPSPWQARFLGLAMRFGDRQTSARLSRHWSHELHDSRWSFGRDDSTASVALRCHAAAAVLSGTDLDVDALIPASLRPKQPADPQRGNGSDDREHDRREWLAKARPFGAAAMLTARSAIGEASASDVVDFVHSGLSGRMTNAGHRWFTHDRPFYAWAVLVAQAAIDTAAPADLFDRLADAAVTLLRDGAPTLWLDLADTLAQRSAHTGKAADLCLRAATHARTQPHQASDRLELLARAASIAAKTLPEVGRQLFDRAVDAAIGINDDAARLLAVHADLASRAAIPVESRAHVAACLVRTAENVAPHVTEPSVVPYAAIAGAAARLSPAIGLATVSRWDDEDRVQLRSTLAGALVGAVDSASLKPTEALRLDHLIEADGARLAFQLDIINRFGETPAGKADARLALARATRWLRCYVPADAQPRLAHRLLEVSSALGTDGQVRAQLERIVSLDLPNGNGRSSTWTSWGNIELPEEIQALLDRAGTRSWRTIGEDIAQFAGARLYGDRVRSFLTTVLETTPPQERPQALAALAALPAQTNMHMVLAVLAEYVTRWGSWPGVTTWAEDALPELLRQHLPNLAWERDHEQVVTQLRAFGDDDTIRRAILAALPEARPQLTAFGWQNITVLLGRLCHSADAAEALVGLLADSGPADAGETYSVVTAESSEAGLVPLLLWSVFGHPRRAMRWRAAHAVRELLTLTDPAITTPLAASLVACLDRPDAGAFRDPALHFYRLSAAAGLLVALCRVAFERPAVLVPHRQDLIRHATSREVPHAQIRELARQAALAVIDPADPAVALLRHENQPTCCLVERETKNHGSDRRISNDRRFDFDMMDTIPYWFAPLARVFDVPVDLIAEHAERWILDKWGFDHEDWWTDRRELRDQRSWERMSHRQGVIPPEENLRLYIEYHAMMAVAGELVDEGRPIVVEVNGFGGEDPWRMWLESHHLPNRPDLWLADLRSAVPLDPELFGHLPSLDEWDVPHRADYDYAFGLIEGQLPDEVVVAGYTRLCRPGGYSTTYIKSALVAPDHAVDLQRALASASNPHDWKLPDEDEANFEVHHGRFDLTGWLTESEQLHEGLDEHDPYAYKLSASCDLPGHRFRTAENAALDRTGLALIGLDKIVLAHVNQWAEPPSNDESVEASSGRSTYAKRGKLLHYLTATGTNLIVEVQIGRNRSGREYSGYRAPRSRIYLIDAGGVVTSR